MLRLQRQGDVYVVAGAVWGPFLAANSNHREKSGTEKTERIDVLKAINAQFTSLNPLNQCLAIYAGLQSYKSHCNR